MEMGNMDVSSIEIFDKTEFTDVRFSIESINSIKKKETLNFFLVPTIAYTGKH